MYSHSLSIFYYLYKYISICQPCFVQGLSLSGVPRRWAIPGSWSSHRPGVDDLVILGHTRSTDVTGIPGLPFFPTEATVDYGKSPFIMGKLWKITIFNG